jgi:acyl-CoA dehydrogenase
MTEPGAGSDLQGVKTSAKKDGNHYVINGSKTFITNGQLANLIIVVTKTDPAKGAKGTSLIVIETDEVEGFERGRNLDKVGLKSERHVGAVLRRCARAHIEPARARKKARASSS